MSIKVEAYDGDVDHSVKLNKKEEVQIVIRKARRKKKKGQWELDFQGLPEEKISHPLTDEQLDAHYRSDNWKCLLDDTSARCRFTPAAWTVERHSVVVAVGKGGNHQDEFLRGDHSNDLLRNSRVTPSLVAAIVNAQYVNSMLLNRIEQEFERNGVYISCQKWLTGRSDAQKIFASTL